VFKFIKGILFDTKELDHSPRPNGLPGGYPVRLSSNGVEIFLHDDLSLDDAIKINTESQIFKGVESIEDDGSVVLTDKSAGIFKELLDFDCKVCTMKNVESKSNELAEKFDKWSKQLAN
jgi:hypothetical protein